MAGLPTTPSGAKVIRFNRVQAARCRLQATRNSTPLPQTGRWKPARIWLVARFTTPRWWWNRRF
jgi:hypothetical protein